MCSIRRGLSHLSISFLANSECITTVENLRAWGGTCQRDKNQITNYLK